MVMIDSRTKTNLFGNPNMITNRKKLETPVNLQTNRGSKILDDIREIPVTEQKIFHTEIISNILSLNEMKKIPGIIQSRR